MDWLYRILCSIYALNNPLEETTESFLSKVHSKPFVNTLLNNPVEQLDKVYFCNSCSAVFLFKSDTEDHDLLYGHTQFRAIALE